ncbi:hypothetical protein [Sulfurimonas indica]|uniref:hypothetical protein n=1 Tax=Sulfurimonas TaxID=202746 RepID=UPI0012652EB9|nr:hypothetical protein [Sulfurimonas indica]
MKQLGERKTNRIKLILRGLCWKIDSFMTWLRNHMFCYYDLEMQEIKEQVRLVHEQSEKFEAVEELAPDILLALERLKHCECIREILEERLGELERLVVDLYVADMNDDRERRMEIYNILIKSKFIRQGE